MTKMPCLMTKWSVVLVPATAGFLGGCYNNFLADLGTTAGQTLVSTLSAALGTIIATAIFGQAPA